MSDKPAGNVVPCTLLLTEVDSEGRDSEGFTLAGREKVGLGWLLAAGSNVKNNQPKQSVTIDSWQYFFWTKREEDFGRQGKKT